MKRAAIAFLVLAQATFVKAEDSRRASLRGLKTIEVIVEKFNEDAVRTGLSEEQLKTDVELRLRKAGIRVAASTLSPYLYVNVSAVQDRGGLCGWAFFAEVSLFQPARLERDKSIFSVARSWNDGFVGVASTDRFVHFVREGVGDKVDKFINDYLAANQ